MTPQSLAQALEPVNWPVFALVSARVAGMMMIAPLWSMSTVPLKIRATLAVILSLAILPGIRATVPTVDQLSLVVPMGTELVIGLAIGLSAAVFLHALTIAAEVMSLQMGLSLGAAIANNSELGNPGVGQIESQFALMVYLTMGGHLALVGALADSFSAIPPGGAIQSAAGGRALLTVGGTVFTSAVMVAAPVMVALLVTNLGLAVMNRAVPQLNTMMVAVPITVSVGLIAIGASLPFLLPLVGRWAGSTGSAAGAIVRAFTPAVVR